MWKAGTLAVFVLGTGGYVEAERSALLPAIDLAFLTSFLGKPASGNTLIELELALAARLGR